MESLLPAGPLAPALSAPDTPRRRPRLPAARPPGEGGRLEAAGGLAEAAGQEDPPGLEELSQQGPPGQGAHLLQGQLSLSQEKYPGSALCMEATYPYVIKNQRKARNDPDRGALVALSWFFMA